MRKGCGRVAEKLKEFMRRLRRAEDCPLVMGILNCTPDSFSDGSNASVEDRVERGLQMIAEGADILDIGGESTRPGAQFIPAQEELRRVLPVIEQLRKVSDAPLSIDTNKAVVAEAALATGVNIINDITALRGEGDMAGLAARTGAPVILMHMQGLPQNMQSSPSYRDVVAEVYAFLCERAEYAQSRGVCPKAILFDPGFGFGKTFAHNAQLLRRLPELAAAGYPLLAGLSRKSMIGQALGLSPEDRLEGSLALALLAVEGGARVVRVHDVKETARALRMRSAVLTAAGA